MTLTPDEIARRGFTPSADGYHQGEVRAFLERIAAEHRAMLATQPGGRPVVADLVLSITNHDKRLNELEQDLELAVSRVEDAAGAVNSRATAVARDIGASARLQAASPTAPPMRPREPRIATVAPPSTPNPPAKSAPATPSPRPTASPKPEPRIATVAPPSTPSQPAKTAAAAASPGPASEPVGTRAAERSVEQSEPESPIAASERETTSTSTARVDAAGSADKVNRANEADEIERDSSLERESTPAPSASSPAKSEPDHRAETPAPRRQSEALSETTTGYLREPLPLLGEIERDPVFTDTANDLLDGILDDVMGNISERPQP